MIFSTHGTRKFILGIAPAVLVIVALATQPAAAESKEVRLSLQYGLNFFPVLVVKEMKLIEKRAKELGLGDVKVTNHQFGGGAAANDAILSGQIDFNATGIGPLITMWDKTAGSLNVRAALPIAATPTTLVTNDPAVHEIKDYKSVQEHKIALPAIKVSIQARFLQIAAARAFGVDHAMSLDTLTVSMKNPDAFVSLKRGSTAVKSHFAVEPYTSMDLGQKNAHAVTSSFDIVGGKHTLTLLWTTERFRTKNPTLYRAVVEAFMEAMDWMNGHPKEVADIFIRLTRSSLKSGEIEAIVSDKNKMDYNYVPMKTLEIANWMHRLGAIKRTPSRWQDLFWDNVHGSKGS